MQQLHSDLWVSESPLRFLGLEVGARMTVVRLPDAKLLVHSPIGMTSDLLREVQSLGSVSYLIAPNKLHHLYMDEWKRAFPEASVYIAPGLDTKRADLADANVLIDEAESGWKDVIDQVLVQGFSFANEVAFFHRPSSTLILTDLAFNIGDNSPPFTRLVVSMIGTKGALSPTLLERLMVRDRIAFRRSLDKILSWPFTRVIVAHGEVSESGGREEIIQGYSWL